MSVIDFLDDLISRYPKLDTCKEDILKTYGLLFDVFSTSNKLFICGNGGSAADSEHMAGELLKGFASKRPLSSKEKNLFSDDLGSFLEGGLPVIPLTSFPALQTAHANDVGEVYTFSQLLWALGQTGDVLFAISTSGSSQNIYYALQTAHVKGIKTILLTGSDPGQCKDVCDVSIQVPEKVTHIIQELHLPVYHTLCLMLEEAFFPSQ